jgi:hypothetical protein
MTIAIAYIYPILFSLLFGYYNGWQWTDEQDGVYDPKKAKPRWKAASIAIRVLSVLAAPGFAYAGLDIVHLAAGVAISLPVFDITINITRGVPVFYLGTTSKTDTFGKWKWITYAILIVATLIPALL